MKNMTLGLAIVFSMSALPALADEPAFQFLREVKTSEHQQEELLAIMLDTDVFAATQDGLPDVRLVDGKGEVAPYLLRRVQATRSRKVHSTWTAGQLSARPLDDGGLEITAELREKDPQPTGLRLVSPLKNFEHRVRIYTSADGMKWEPAGDEAVIFDYSRYVDVRSDKISFPETDRRHFRIVIDDVTAEQESELLRLTRRLRGAEETERSERVTIDRRPFRIDRVDFVREEEQKQATGDEKVKYPVLKFQVEQDSENQQTIIFVDTKRQPLTSLKLATSDKNFIRRAVVEVEKVKGVKRTWRKIGEGAVSRIDFKNLKRENLSISFRESRQAQYRIVIDNRDNAPLEITGIEAEGNRYELVFLAAPDTGYQLFYGAADAESATYDTAAIQELLRRGFQPLQVELGVQQPSEGASRPAAFRWTQLLNNSWLLGSVITLLVIVLGWGLYHAVKRMDKLQSD